MELHKVAHRGGFLTLRKIEAVAKLIIQKYSRLEKIFDRSYRADNED